ncbi:MAG: hypothetical protein AAGL29_14150 [Bacteroidota bacterium]
MKPFSFSIVFFLTIATAIAQINVGNGRGAGNLWVGSHSQKTFDKLKTTTTYFALPDVCNSSELKSVIASVWTFNKIEFVPSDAFRNNRKKYVSPENLLINLRDLEFTVSKDGLPAGFFGKFYFLVSTYKSVKETSKGEVKGDFLDISEIYLSKNLLYEEEGQTQYCLNLGLIKNYFQLLNRKLSNSENLKMNDGIVDKETLATLKSKTLYLPWKLKEGLDEEQVEYQKKLIEKTLSKYEFDYKIVSYSELGDRILNGEDIYYVNETPFFRFYILSIANSKTGEIIYLNNKGNFRIGPGEMKKINGLVSKD